MLKTFIGSQAISTPIYHNFNDYFIIKIFTFYYLTDADTISLLLNACLFLVLKWLTF